MLTRRRILITGATDGIGRLAALNLARQGAELILTARSKEKAMETCAAIKAVAPSVSVDVHFVDFSDLQAVVDAGRAIAKQHEHIDVLINNAGLHAFKQRVTADGYAEMIAVNYFAPWLLTQSLMETLRRSAPSRIVTVGSQASRQSGGLDSEKDLTDIAPFTARGSSRIYGRTKLLDIMFSLELARRLAGTGVVSNCLCPGFNVTGLGRELRFAGVLASVLNRLGVGDPLRGAEIITRLATDPAFGEENGLYVSGSDAHALTPVFPADNIDARQLLWDRTTELLARFS